MQNRLTDYVSNQFRKMKDQLTKTFFLALVYLFYNYSYSSLYSNFFSYIILNCAVNLGLPFMKKKRRKRIFFK